MPTSNQIRSWPSRTQRRHEFVDEDPDLSRQVAAAEVDRVQVEIHRAVIGKQRHQSAARQLLSHDELGLHDDSATGDREVTQEVTVAGMDGGIDTHAGDRAPRIRECPLVASPKIAEAQRGVMSELAG